MVTAKAPALGGLGGSVQVDLVAEGDEVFALVQLEPTADIVGRLLLPGGTPAPTSEVRLERWGGGLVDVATTDGDGRFEFSLLPLGLYRLVGFDPATGRRGRSDWLTLGAGGEIQTADVTLEARGAVEGHLTEPGSGLGVAGATVALQSQGLVIFTTYSSTDGTGFFEFLGIPQGSFKLWTQEPLGRRRATGLGTLLEEGQRVTVDLVLEASGRVLGTALRPPGATPGAFAPANVLLFQDGQAIGATLDNPYAFDGVIANRAFTLEAREVGGPHRGRATGKIQSEGEELTLDVTMVPRGQASVLVLDGAAQPVAGATVTMLANGFYGSKRFGATTAGDGRVTFPDVGAGQLSASAVAPSGLRGSIGGTLELEGQTAELTLALESSGRVFGRALRADGATAAAETLVVLVSGNRTLQLLTEADGSFSFPSVPLGSFRLYFQERFGAGSLERAASLSTAGQELDLGSLVLDDRSPSVTALEPLSGSQNVPRSSALVVRFDEPIDKTRHQAAWFGLTTVSGAAVVHAVTWSDDDRTATLQPLQPLASFAYYQLTVHQSYDRAGRALLAKARTSFRTADTVPPAVVEFRPRHDESQVALASPVRITFSEPILASSLSGSALQLTDLDAGAGVGTTFVVEPGERVVTLTPVGGLQSDRPYRITVQGVLDAGGNVMAAPVSATFWTLDTLAPEISGVDFPVGTSFTAGDEIPVTVTASDRRGIARVGLQLGDWLWSDTSAPYQLVAIAPIVSATETRTLVVRAVDRFGNVTTTERTVTIAPRADATPPAVTVPCGEDGVAIPGLPLELRLAATDDQRLESVTFRIDGQAVYHRSPIAAPTALDSFLWTPPAAAPAGTTWLARLEARDFAGTVTAREITLTAPTGTVLRGGRSLFDTYAGQDLVLAEGEFLARDTLHAASLVVARAANLAPATDGSDVDLTLSGPLAVQCGGGIDVSDRGYASGSAGQTTGSAPSGVAASTSGAGGSHGGRGARAGAGPVYDGVYRPELGGGGGGGGPTVPLQGGGVLRIAAGAVRLDGDLRALGAAAHCVGGSAGGTVAIAATSLTGSGLIDASSRGDDVNCGINSNPFGGGGGGRVALTLGSLDGFEPRTQIRARGGYDLHREYGGPGTVYLQTAADPYGRLFLDNGLTTSGAPRIGPITDLPALGAGTVTTTTPEGTDLWVTPSTQLPRLWLGAWMALQSNTGTALGTFRVLDLDATGRVRLAGAAGVTTAATFRGEYRFDEIVAAPGVSYRASDPLTVSRLELAGETPVPVAGLAAESILIRSGATLRPVSGSTVRLTATNRLTIEAGATIDVTGLGYAGGAATHPGGYAPEGVATGDGAGSGGTHGGQGIHYTNGYAPMGETYGSLYFPAFSGGGSARTVTNGTGAPGGGLVELNAAELILDGQVVASGLGGCLGGAGGSIVVSAGVVRGDGSLVADGGSRFGCATYNGAPGGGGRVAIAAGSFDGFEPALQAFARGGTMSVVPAVFAAPGTVYWKAAADGFGHLRIDQRATASSVSIPATVLPGIGVGEVAETLAAPEAPGAFWLRPTEPAKTFGRGVAGMWLRLGGLDYRVRGESLDRKWLLVEGDRATVPGGASFVGLHRFDTMTVTGKAKATLVDGAEIGTLTVDAGSAFEAIDTAQPPLAITAPAAGTTYDAGQLASVTTALTGSRTLTRVDFRLGDQTASDTTAPYSWLVPAPAVAATTTLQVQARAVEPNGNVWLVERPIEVRPIPVGGLPTVAITCPSSPAVATPGMAIDVAVTASHAQGIERVELLAASDLSTVLATDFDAPYTLRFSAPAGLVAGETVELVARARSFSGATASTTVPVTIKAGTVFSADARISPSDLSFEGQSLFVTAGTLTIDGEHSFGDLVVGAGAKVTQSSWASASSPRPVGLTLAGDLHVACGGSFDVTGKGYPGGVRPDAEPLLAWDDFNDYDLEGWQAVSPGAYLGPANWTFSNGVLWQSSDIQACNCYDQHPVGTLLRWTAGGDWTDVRASFRMLSTDDDALGAMFRFQDSQNHYRFYWNRQLGIRRLEKVQNGVLQTLAGDTVQYTMSRWYAVELVAVGSHVEVWLDGVRILEADDSTFSKGSFAFLSSGNRGTQFDDFVVRRADLPAATSPWKTLLSEDFQDNNATGWSVTNVGTNTASNWSVQSSSFYNQSANVVSTTGVGTLSHWLTGSWSDFHFSARINSIARDDIGLLFRYLDPDNYYRFHWRGNNPVSRSLTKRVGGVNTTLASDTAALVGNRWYSIDIVARGSRLEVWVDQERVFAVDDPSLTTGTVAAATNNTERRWFDDLTIDTGSSFGRGGSHGGAGGGDAPPRWAVGSLFDPAEPGAGGGGLARSAPGGGVVRVTAAGAIVVDGEVLAKGTALTKSTDQGAGGSIRLAAPAIRGAGTIDASGGGTATQARAAGSGGRIALVGSTVATDLVGRTKAAGGSASRSDLTGAAGTIFVRRAGEAHGELIVDNAGRVSTGWTELPAVGTGTVEVVETARVTDLDRTFPWSVVGHEIRFDGTGPRWPVEKQSSDRHQLELDVTAAPLTAASGSTYQGHLVLDRLTIRGAARVRTKDAVVLGTPATVESGSEWLPEAPESAPVGFSSGEESQDERGPMAEEEKAEELGGQEGLLAGSAEPELGVFEGGRRETGERADAEVRPDGTGVPSRGRPPCRPILRGCDPGGSRRGGGLPWPPSGAAGAAATADRPSSSLPSSFAFFSLGGVR